MYVKEGRWLPSLTVLTAASCAAELSSGAVSKQVLSPVDTLSGSEGSHPAWSLLSLTLCFCIGETLGFSFLVRHMSISNVTTF